MQTELKADVDKRRNLPIVKHVQRLGLGTAFLMSLKPTIQTSPMMTHIHTQVSTPAKVAIRKLRAGLIPHMRVLMCMRDLKFNQMTHEERLDEVICHCQPAMELGEESGVQDVNHLMYYCNAAKPYLGKLAESILQAAMALSHSYGQKVGLMTDQQRVLEVLHSTGPRIPGDGLRKLFRQYGLAVTVFLAEMEEMLRLAVGAELF